MFNQHDFYHPINKPSNKGNTKRFIVRENKISVFDTKVPASLYGRLKELQVMYGQSNLPLLKHWVEFGTVRTMLSDKYWEAIDIVAEQNGCRSSEVIARIITDRVDLWEKNLIAKQNGKQTDKAVEQSNKENSK